MIITAAGEEGDDHGSYTELQIFGILKKKRELVIGFRNNGLGLENGVLSKLLDWETTEPDSWIRWVILFHIYQ